MATSEPVVIPLVIDGKTIIPTMTNLRTELRAAKSEQDKLTAGSKEFETAGQRVKLLSDKLEEQKEATKKSREEGSKLNDTLRGLGPAGNFIADIRDKFTGVKSQIAEGGKSVQGFSTSLKLISAAGIFLIITALTSLVAWFKSTDSGAKFLEGTMNAISNITKVLTGYIIDFGKALYTAITAPGEALAKLSNALLHPIDTFNSLSDGAKKFASDMEDATKAGFELAEAMDKIDSSQRNVNEANALYDKQITELLIKSKDRTKSEKERLDFLDQASKLEEINLSRTINLQKQKLAAVQLEIDQEAKRVGIDEVSDDLLNKRSQLVVEQIKLEQESANLQEKVSNRRNALIDAENSNNEKAAEQRKKQLEKEAAEREKLAQKQLTDMEKLDDELTQIQLASIQDTFEREKQARQIAYNEKRDELISDNLLTAEIEKGMREQLNSDLAEIDAKAEEKRRQDADKARQEKVQEYDLLAEEEKFAIEKQFANRLITEKEKNEELLKINIKYNKEKLDLFQGNSLKDRQERVKYDGAILKDQTKIAEDSLVVDKNLAKAQGIIRSQNFQDAKSVLQQGIQLMKEDTEARRVAIGILKAASLAEVGINLAVEIANHAKNAAANPLNAVTFGAAGTIQAAVQIGLAVARAAIQTTAILGAKFEQGGSVPVLKWRGPVQQMFTNALGGEVRGSRHASRYGDGGIAMFDRLSGFEVGEMEGGEGILTRNVMLNPRLRSMASAINVAGGGKSFAEGGAVDGSASVPITMEEFTAKFDQMIAIQQANSNKIDAWQRNLTVTNSIIDVSKKQTELDKMVQNANI
jgi:hypothetical protein